MERKGANLLICCEVCAEEFSHEEDHAPKLLSCGHSYCQTCLSKLQKTTSVAKERYVHAPNAYEKSNNRGDGVGRDQPLRFVFSTAKSFYTRDIMHTNQYEIVCPKCKKKSVSDKPCSSLPKNYSYLEFIEEVLPVLENENKRPKSCKEHANYVLDMFCHNEEETICLYCADYGEHKGHNVSRLSGFSDHKRTSIKRRIDTLENIIDNYSELSSALEVREHELTDKVESIRKSITSKFESVQSEIKRILDTKLETVLNQLDDCSAVQLSLFQHAKESLDVQGFKDIQTKAKTFLSEADESTIATEKDLLSDMQAKIDETQNHTMCTKHIYEVQVDCADHIVQSVQDLVDSWVCCVKQTTVPSCEYVSTVIDRYFPSYGESINILFGEKLLYEHFTDKPFQMNDCKLWWDGVLSR